MSVRPYLIVTVLGAAAVAGCGKSSISWKEEVLLANAEVIVVERSAKTKAFGEIGGPGGWENEGSGPNALPRCNGGMFWQEDVYADFRFHTQHATDWPAIHQEIVRVLSLAKKVQP